MVFLYSIYKALRMLLRNVRISVFKNVESLNVNLDKIVICLQDMIFRINSFNGNSFY